VNITKVVLLAFAIVLGRAPAAPAQDVKAAVRDKFMAALPKLQASYCRDRRIRVNFAFEQVDDKATVMSHVKSRRGHNVIVFDAFGNMKSEYFDAAKNFNRASYFVDDRQFTVEKIGSAHSIGSYTLHDDPQRALAARDFSGAALLPMSFDGVHSIHAYLNSKHCDTHDARVLVLDALSEAEFLGRTCVALHLHGEATLLADLESRPVASTFTAIQYYDPARAMIYMGCLYASPGNLSFPRPHKRRDAMEYHTVVGEVQPMPKRFTRHIEFEGEPKRLQLEYDFVSFETYVPEPEEFRLEKQFDLPTPMGQEGKALVGAVVGGGSFGRLNPFLIVAGVAVTGLVVRFVRRRRVKV